jgi:hypothetical protein
MPGLLATRWLVVKHALDNFDYFIALSQSESFFPQPGALISNDDDVEVILFVADKLPQLFQREVYVLLITG